MYYIIMTLVFKSYIILLSVTIQTILSFNIS